MSHAIVSVGALLILTAGATVARGRASSSFSSRDALSLPESTAVADVQTFSPRILATGNIRLLPGARIDVGARVSGVVQSLDVSQGSRVAKGDVIARLDTREPAARVAQANAAVSELEASVAQLTENLARTVVLAHADASTPQELLAARTALSTANARLGGALSLRDLARTVLDYSVVRAPIAGVVASVTTHEGETVAASLTAPTFVTLIDPTRLECVALVDETDISHVVPGDTVEFTVDTYPGRIFHGSVVRVAPDATVISGVVDYEVTVRIRDGIADLKPQMTASVSIASASHKGLVIPTSAVRQSPQGASVWRRRDGVVQRVPVQLGDRQAELSEIRGGLASGDTVLIARFPESR